jgi:hypothetical protein
MNKWQSFLNSISTPGGNLLILSLFVIALLCVVIAEIHHGDEGQVQTVVLSTFSGFAGALLQALRGRTTDIPAPPGSTSTTATTSHSSEAPKEEAPKP